MGRHVRKHPIKAWFDRHWEAMFIVIPVAAMGLVASIIAATNI
jgi:hypothetical protein